MFTTPSTSDVGSTMIPDSVPLAPEGEAFHVPFKATPSEVPRALKVPPNSEPVRAKEPPSTVPVKVPGPSVTHDIVPLKLADPSWTRT